MLLAAILTACALSAVAAAAASAATLTGDGSTLVAPLEAEWGSAFQSKTHITVNYSSVGSGQGIQDISSRLVDFGASDAPLTPTQAQACNGCAQIPWALSAVGVGYNLPGIHKLRLTGPVVAQIYQGQITTWNDSRIAKLNPGVHLPNLKITPLHRSDGSGTTYAFTNYLSDISASWRSHIGFATSVSFPVGIGGKGNAGVAAILEATKGAMSYNEVAYLIANSLPAAAIKNAAGNYEYPNLNNIEVAARTVKHVPANNEMHIVNPPRSARIAYPISTFTYAIVPLSGNKQVSLLKQWLTYVVGPGQAFGPSLDFAPVPKIILNAAKATIKRIH